MDEWLRAAVGSGGLLDPKDWIALVLAALALLVSLAVAAYTVKSERKMAKMATYERLHEQLLPADCDGETGSLLARTHQRLPIAIFSSSR